MVGQGLVGEMPTRGCILQRNGTGRQGYLDGEVRKGTTSSARLFSTMGLKAAAHRGRVGGCVGIWRSAFPAHLVD